MTDPNAGIRRFLADIHAINFRTGKAWIERFGPEHAAERANAILRGDNPRDVPEPAPTPESSPEARITHARGGIRVHADFRGDTCDTCPAEIAPYAECYVYRDGTMRCLDCGRA